MEGKKLIVSRLIKATGLLKRHINSYGGDVMEVSNFGPSRFGLVTSQHYLEKSESV